jgi:hypothetical protein
MFPGIDALREQRAELMAGLTFVEGALQFSRADLREWFRTNAEALGHKDGWASIRAAPGRRAIPLDDLPVARHEDLPRLLAMARWTVVLTMRGMLSTPADDRFLHAAIFARRVRRHDGAWRVATQDDHPLSDIVLALFAADVLAHREFHEQNLCVCDVCGRISFSPTLTTRVGCVEHLPLAAPGSGPRSLRRW